MALHTVGQFKTWTTEIPAAIFVSLTKQRTCGRDSERVVPSCLLSLFFPVAMVEDQTSFCQVSACISISMVIQHDVLMSLKGKVLESQIEAKALVLGLMGSCCDRYSRLAPCSCRVHLCQSTTRRAPPSRRILEIRVVRRNLRKSLCEEAYKEHRRDASASSGSAPERERSQFDLMGLKC